MDEFVQNIIRQARSTNDPAAWEWIERALQRNIINNLVGLPVWVVTERNRHDEVSNTVFISEKSAIDYIYNEMSSNWPEDEDLATRISMDNLSIKEALEIYNDNSLKLEFPEETTLQK